MTESKSLRTRCVVCQLEKDCTHSLRLTRVKGAWQSNPVCADCRQTLIRQARIEGRFIPFYSLSSSEEEVKKRNGETLRYKPFLEKFGRKEDAKARPNKVKPKLQIAASCQK